MNQIALPLAWAADARDAEFLVTESNARAVQTLEHWATWPVRTALLVGPPRSGRTLLAQVFAARSHGDVIDDADRCPEVELFHAWNRAQAERRPLVLVAAEPPPRWEITIPDLRTRLAASPVAAIEPPDDMLVHLLLERGFERRRLDARPELVAWLAPRVERSHAAVATVLDRLQAAAMASRRRLSIPFARAVLAPVDDMQQENGG